MSRFKRDDLPFHIVSLANYQQRVEEPRDNPWSWAELREAQAMTARSLENCALAITIDIGDADDIHPKNKRDVGKRLALAALADTYGKDVVGSGPWFRTMEIESGRIRLHFDHTDGGLKFKGSTGQSFAVAGADQKFFWAKAEIDGDTIVVSSSEVPHPLAVRYAWDNNPEACLYNGAGLPAVPFRSDDW
jgi:sialate O-acetylesterase